LEKSKRGLLARFSPTSFAPLIQVGGVVLVFASPLVMQSGLLYLEVVAFLGYQVCASARLSLGD
jgi:hypothetical protein